MLDHSERPWGRWIKTDEGNGFWVKKIEVNPGGKLSLQKHTGRSEVWTVVQGNGTVTLNDTSIVVRAGSVIQIGVGDIHRIENTTNTIPLLFIEVALGTDLREDDIIRIEDDYGRA